MDRLVEAVAQIIADRTDETWLSSLSLARAVIPVVREHCAKVAEEKAREAFMLADLYEPATSLYNEMRSCGHTGNEIAAAIRGEAK